MPLLVVVLALLLPNIAFAAISVQDCIECHEKQKLFSHGGTGCTDCHSTITSLPHDEKLPRPSCVSCHKKTVVTYGESAHGKAEMGCNQCHAVHFIEKRKTTCASCHSDADHTSLPSSKKHLAALTCIACHGRPGKGEMTINIGIKDEKRITIEMVDRNRDNIVDRAEWYALENLLASELKGRHKVEKVFRFDGDPHKATKSIGCDSCHSSRGLFPTAKLKMAGKLSFESAIDPRIFMPELPAVEDFSETAHGKAGVECGDCHTWQKKMSEAWSETSGICAKCHKEVEGIYNSSLHAQEGATQCIDCHNPHTVKPYRELSARERVVVCARCHKDYLQVHNWLPNTALHFEYLECATCHSPRSKKSVVFYFAKKTPEGKAALTFDELTALYGEDPMSHINRSKSKEGYDLLLGEMFTLLREREKNLIVDAKIIVTEAYHNYSETHPKEKECLTCHSRNASFYESMFFLLPGKETANYVPVRGTLISEYPIATFVDFFIIGQDKLTIADLKSVFGSGSAGEPAGRGLGFKWIDFFGILLTGLIVLAIIVHVIARLVFRQ
jgi:predicted CXXCH cytochrome family protein